MWQELGELRDQISHQVASLTVVVLFRCRSVAIRRVCLRAVLWVSKPMAGAVSSGHCAQSWQHSLWVPRCLRRLVLQDPATASACISCWTSWLWRSCLCAVDMQQRHGHRSMSFMFALTTSVAAPQFRKSWHVFGCACTRHQVCRLRRALRLEV